MWPLEVTPQEIEDHLTHSGRSLFVYQKLRSRDGVKAGEPWELQRHFSGKSNWESWIVFSPDEEHGHGRFAVPMWSEAVQASRPKTASSCVCGSAPVGGITVEPKTPEAFSSASCGFICS